MQQLFEGIERADALLDRLFSPLCKKYDLTYMELTILTFLGIHPQYDTAADIIRLRNFSKSHVSTSIRSLTEKGLVTGSYRDGNRKTIHLTPTEKAAPIIADGCIARDSFSRILLDGFTAEEADAMRHSIQRLTDNITRYLDRP